MKYYSEILNKMFNTEKECKDAEIKHAEIYVNSVLNVRKITDDLFEQALSCTNTKKQDAITEIYKAANVCVTGILNDKVTKEKQIKPWLSDYYTILDTLFGGYNV